MLTDLDAYNFVQVQKLNSRGPCFCTGRPSRQSWVLKSIIGHSANIRPWRTDGGSNPTIHHSLVAVELAGRSVRKKTGTN